MGAALWGMSLVGPQVGAALADDGSSSSSSARSSSDTGRSNSDAGPKKSATTAGADAAKSSSTKAAKAAKSKEARAAKDADSDSETAESDDRSGIGTQDARASDTDTQRTRPQSRSATADSEVATPDEVSDDALADTSPATPAANLVPGPTSGAATLPSTADDQDSPASAAAVPSGGDPWGLGHEAEAVDPWQENTSAIISATTENLQLLINTVPVPQLRDALAGTLWTVRRTFFNLAPTMNESYSVTSGLGTIVGQAKATDPENDRIQYRVVQGPLYGTLTLNADGSYSYTPAAEFDGVDTFAIEAVDLGWHVNVLEPFRGAGTAASMLVNQNAIDFDFSYNDPEGYFTADAKEALYQSAKRLSVYFLVDQKTVLTYTVKSEYIEDGYLASAFSGWSGDEPGFSGSVVQEKLINGLDTNGEAADGDISWNWAYNWGYYPSVGDDQYDFTSTVMHELLHSFGWIAGIARPGGNDGDAWYTYAQFVTTKDGDSPINPETFAWNSDYDPYLTGYGGGMYFTGANALAAFGGRPVPLYTPAVWSGGSSISHLDDDTFAGPNHVMMDHAAASMGRDNIALSPVELGILKDLGYTVVPSPWFAYPPVLPTPAPEVDL